jgi:hypothetical protein
MIQGKILNQFHLNAEGFEFIYTMYQEYNGRIVFETEYANKSLP